MTEEDQAFAGELNQPAGFAVGDNAISIREEIEEHIQAEQPGRPPFGHLPALNEDIQQLQELNTNLKAGPSAKPKLSSRMKKKSKDWNLKRSTSLTDLNQDIKEEDPSKQTAPSSKLKANPKLKNPYLSQFENAMRVFNFKKEDGEGAGNQTDRPASELKMTR